MTLIKNHSENRPSYVIVGMSGGVDSSVAAFLLKQAGHHVEGVFMKNWEEDDTGTYCSAEKDISDAKKVCERLNIDLHIVNFAAQYWEKVFAYFLDEYRKGRTPNPDILCNKEIKFNAFLNHAKKRGADYIATGHYVRAHSINNHTYLLRGNDPLKDQSYFLHALNEEQLSQSLFPVGAFGKQEVRALAEHIGLANYAKKDSTGICFIGERKFKTFLQDYLPALPGKIETLEGEVIGEHDGLMFYTIGQRQGLQIGGKAGKAESPWYVAEKDIKRNVLIVVQGNHPALYKKSLMVNHLHWINDSPSSPALTAKIRYRQADQSCFIKKIGTARAEVTFTHPQRAVTPGQSIVFYEDHICLGGGIIES